MRAEVFCDSNVLLYAASNADEDAAKRAAARRILALPGVGFSAQVLQEFLRQCDPETGAAALGG